MNQPHRHNTKRRAQSNAYLNTPLGVLKRVSDRMAGVVLDENDPAFSQPALNGAVQESCSLLNKALAGQYLREPAMWLRRASLMQQDSTLSDDDKRHAAERAVRMMEIALDKGPAPAVGFCEKIHINAMVGLAFRYEEPAPDLTLRLLDIVDLIDPDNMQYIDQRSDLRERCQPISIRPYLPPAHPGGISLSALPPAINPRPK